MGRDGKMKSILSRRKQKAKVQRPQERERWSGRGTQSLTIWGDAIQNATEMLQVWNGKEENWDWLCHLGENKNIAEALVKQDLEDRFNNNGGRYFKWLRDHKNEFNEMTVAKYHKLLNEKRHLLGYCMHSLYVQRLNGRLRSGIKGLLGE